MELTSNSDIFPAIIIHGQDTVLLSAKYCISDRHDRFCLCLAARPSFMIPCLNQSDFAYKILRFLGVCRNLPVPLSNTLLIHLPRQRKNGGRRAGQDGHRRSKDRPLEAFHHSSDQRFLLRNQRRAVLHIPMRQGEDTRNGYGSRHTCGQGVPGEFKTES